MDNRRRMMWKKPPENAIYYTSTDGNIVTPYTTYGWGANIVSNTYENGVGKILFNKKVTMAPKEAFRNKKTLSSIEFPDSITSIGDWAFYYCSLTSVTIPDSVTTIGLRAFYNCTSLTSVTIGNGVTTIGEETFRACSSLTSVTIPNGVTSIGYRAFSYCTSLTSFYGKFASEDNRCLIVDGKLIAFAPAGLTEYTIPNSVTSIGESAFLNCRSLTSVTISDGVTEIGDNAFNWCDSLTNVTIPDSVTSIGDNAFYWCNSLTSITIPDSVTSIGDGAFQICESLTSVIIPDSVTTIGNQAFYKCTSLTSVIIPNGVTSIGAEAFYNCTSLTSITIPDSVTSIGSKAIVGCRSLTSIIVSEGNSVYDSRENCNAIIETATNKLVIGCNETIILDSVTEIGAYAFNYCTSLTSIVIPDSVTEIGAYAFDYCTSLTSVTIGNGVTEIGTYAFNYCFHLKNIYSLNPIAPTITFDSFRNVASSGVLIHPTNSDYSSWMQTNQHYLGYYNWTSQWSYAPQTYYGLSITAQDVIGNSTTTTISWTCMSDGIDTITGETITGIQLSGTATSEEFPQNTSETETVERTITFEYQGLTASTTITQGVWGNQSYELVLNDNWQLSTAVANPDSALYDGVYESFSNYNVGSTAAIMYIDINGYETFKLYIRSYAESSYDYVMVSQIDQTIDNNSSYSNTTLVKAHTRGTQKSGTTISDYTLVEFTGLGGGEHRITVVYRKDGSGNSGTDKGYLIIPKQ